MSSHLESSAKKSKDQILLPSQRFVPTENKHSKEKWLDDIVKSVIGTVKLDPKPKSTSRSSILQTSILEKWYKENKRLSPIVKSQTSETTHTPRSKRSNTTSSPYQTSILQSCSASSKTLTPSLTRHSRILFNKSPMATDQNINETKHMTYLRCAEPSGFRDATLYSTSRDARPVEYNAVSEAESGIDFEEDDDIPNDSHMDEIKSKDGNSEYENSQYPYNSSRPSFKSISTFGEGERNGYRREELNFDIVQSYHDELDASSFRPDFLSEAEIYQPVQEMCEESKSGTFLPLPSDISTTDYIRLTCGPPSPHRRSSEDFSSHSHSPSCPSTFIPSPNLY